MNQTTEAILCATCGAVFLFVNYRLWFAFVLVAFVGSGFFPSTALALHAQLNKTGVDEGGYGYCAPNAVTEFARGGAPGFHVNLDVKWDDGVVTNFTSSGTRDRGDQGYVEVTIQLRCSGCTSGGDDIMEALVYYIPATPDPDYPYWRIISPEIYNGTGEVVDYVLSVVFEDSACDGSQTGVTLDVPLQPNQTFKALVLDDNKPKLTLWQKIGESLTKIGTVSPQALYNYQCPDMPDDIGLYFNTTDGMPPDYEFPRLDLDFDSFEDGFLAQEGIEPYDPGNYAMLDPLMETPEEGDDSLDIAQQEAGNLDKLARQQQYLWKRAEQNQDGRFQLLNQQQETRNERQYVWQNDMLIELGTLRDDAKNESNESQMQGAEIVSGLDTLHADNQLIVAEISSLDTSLADIEQAVDEHKQADVDGHLAVVAAVEGLKTDTVASGSASDVLLAEIADNTERNADAADSIDSFIVERLLPGAEDSTDWDAHAGALRSSAETYVGNSLSDVVPSGGSGVDIHGAGEQGGQPLGTLEADCGLLGVVNLNPFEDDFVTAWVLPFAYYGREIILWCLVAWFAVDVVKLLQELLLGLAQVRAPTPSTGVENIAPGVPQAKLWGSQAIAVTIIVGVIVAAILLVNSSLADMFFEGGGGWERNLANLTSMQWDFGHVRTAWTILDMFVPVGAMLVMVSVELLLRLAIFGLSAAAALVLRFMNA